MNDRTNGRRTPPKRIETRVVTAGRDPESYHGFVNPPVYHASTVLYPSAEDYVAHRARYQYGRRGTPTTEALELALQDLDGPELRRRLATAIRTCGDLHGPACRL
jgi:cystathionine beta-lyase/cystathionine gamma-synthase